MGAVQKLATVVIIGLVALATVLVVYLADEPNRRGSESTEQEALALERGTSLYITYCLQCHGPAGLGARSGEDPARIGPNLNQGPFELPNLETPTAIHFQSDDPVQQARAEAYIRYSIIYGKPADPRLPKVMPAFGQDLNVEEVNDLVYLIMYGDWNYVYNESLLYTGNAQAQADCDADPSNTEACEHAHDETYALYPTAPAPAEAEEDAAEGEATPDGEGTPEGGEGDQAGGTLLEAQDPFNWSETEITVNPGDTIEVVNAGALEHDFTVDELGIHEVLTGDPVTITIPEDAEPGTYEFYCSVPGHREGGMVGTLTIEAP